MQDDRQKESAEDNMYLRFDLVLSDVSAFLFDGDYHWSQVSLNTSTHSRTRDFYPVIDRCGVILQLQLVKFLAFGNVRYRSISFMKSILILFVTMTRFSQRLLIILRCALL
jgi:hypothetical protein